MISLGLLAWFIHFQKRFVPKTKLSIGKSVAVPTMYVVSFSVLYIGIKKNIITK